MRSPAVRTADRRWSSTLLLAAAYPASQVVGFDYHDASIDQARTVMVNWMVYAGTH